ncbi:MAG TPA: hypothetical protein VGR56_02175 [Nitrososphaerales archaeon]|nr:hypothetical protein [Nitrososphaerales archaeon]
MNPDLVMVLALRRVMESVEEGMGMSQALVRELGGVGPAGVEAVRKLLLGFPFAVSLHPFRESKSDEVSMLASLLVSASKSNTSLVGKNGEAVSHTLEGWLKLKENGKLEHRVIRFRSMITSGVLGAVSATIATLGPLLGNLDFTTQARPDPGALLIFAAGMTIISSGMLGFFMSGSRFFVNIAISLTVFAFVWSLASPIASIPMVPLLGVK